MPRPRVILLNRTDPTHPGCSLTVECLTALIRKYGTLVESVPTPRAGPENRQEVDFTRAEVVVINGEGTMHHHSAAKPRHAAAELQRQAELAKKAGLRVALVNTVIQEFDADLSCYDYISTRESLSFAEASARHPRVELVPDACFLHLPRGFKPSSRNVIVTDSVYDNVSRELQALAAKRGWKFLPFKRLGSLQALTRFQSAKLVITGRYHGVVFALMTHTPVLCVESNTHKIHGLLHDFGIGDALASDTAHLPEHGLVSTRDLPPIQDQIEASVRRAILGDAWDALRDNERNAPPPNLWGPRLWRKVRRLVTPMNRRHTLDLPPKFIRPIALHPGYREVRWPGEEPVGRLRPLRSLHDSDKRDAFVVATGPSLETLDLTPLRGRACFAVNGSIVKFRELGFAPDYFVVTDKGFVDSRFDLVKQGLASGAKCFFPSRVLSHICERDPRVLGGAELYLMDPINSRYDAPSLSNDELRRTLARDRDILLHPTATHDTEFIGFSKDLEKGSFHSKTVVHAALQVAWYVGVRRVMILGMDMGAPAGGPMRFYEKSADNPASFLGDFLQSHIVPSLEIVRDMRKGNGFEVYNACPTSRLPAEVLPKITMEEAVQLLARPR
ncbi:MAG: polysaccharide pyruvyl transferase family protein [Planctomycetes bacterium]|nr:polysaccharide pyruvyl transferase family protein [Planctomycetota bacterium]